MKDIIEKKERTKGEKINNNDMSSDRRHLKMSVLQNSLVFVGRPERLIIRFLARIVISVCM